MVCMVFKGVRWSFWVSNGINRVFLAGGCEIRGNSFGYAWYARRKSSMNVRGVVYVVWMVCIDHFGYALVSIGYALVSIGYVKRVVVKYGEIHLSVGLGM